MNQTSNIKLQVQDLHKSYGSHEVLKGVSLTAHAGDVISIIGSSGSGKSTFLRCINMLEQPNSGSIAVTGEQLALTTDKRNGALKAADAKQLARIRTKLAMVFQHFNLWRTRPCCRTSSRPRCTCSAFPRTKPWNAPAST